MTAEVTELATTENKHYKALEGFDLQPYVAKGDEIDEYQSAPRGKAEVADPIRDKFLVWAQEQKQHYFKLSEANGADPEPFTREYPPRVVPVQTKEQMEAVKNYASVTAGKVEMGVRFAKGHDEPRSDGSYKVAYCLVRKSERKPRADKGGTRTTDTPATEDNTEE